MNVRKRLEELIAAGMRGRSMGIFHEQAQQHFRKYGEKLPLETLTSWMCGSVFPSTQYRQNLLAEVVGGQWGEEIKRLPEPAFRKYTGYKRGDMQTTKKPQGFPTVQRQVGGKTVTYKRISCGKCDATAEHPFRVQLRIHDDFKKKGWVVGATAHQNRCPQCQDKKKMPRFDQHNGKVIEMTPRILEAQQQELEPVGEMPPEDFGLLILHIAERWDKANTRYQPGSSDLKVAKETGKPIEWVKAVREQHFRGSGEDPADLQSIEALLGMKVELEGLLLDQKTLHDGDLRVRQKVDEALDLAKKAHSEAEVQRLERERTMERTNNLKRRLEALEAKLPFPKAKAS